KSIRAHKEIGLLNRFWGRFLTISFVAYTIEVSYTSYVTIFKSSTKSWFEIGFVTYFCLVFFATLVGMTYECSLIVYRNQKISQLQRMFCVAFQRSTHVKLNVLLKVIFL